MNKKKWARTCVAIAVGVAMISGAGAVGSERSYAASYGDIGTSVNPSGNGAAMKKDPAEHKSNVSDDLARYNQILAAILAKLKEINESQPEVVNPDSTGRP